jgi:enoyl-[acyl-carrier-protein] reductase (NADH)
VDNDLMRAAAGNTEEGWQKLISRMPGKKIVTGEESANLGLYLCSDLTESFYGQVIPLSGGVYR